MIMAKYLDIITKYIQNRSQKFKYANWFLVHQRCTLSISPLSSPVNSVPKNTPQSYVSCRRKCSTEEPYYQYKYKPELELAINEQIQAEQQAGQDYLNMAVYFLHPAVSRPGTGGFFMRMYEEEIGHMKNVIQYQLFRGGRVVTPCLGKPPSHDQLTMLGAFELALQMEKTVTELIVHIVRAAEKVKDNQCADHFTSEFLKEQKKSVNDLAHHVTQLKRLNGAGEPALHYYDLQLVKKYPYSFTKIGM